MAGRACGKRPGVAKSEWRVTIFNLGALVSLEIIARRIAVIMEAYFNPQRPSWEVSKYYTGVASIDDGIAPSLRTFVAKRAKEESDLLAVRSKAKDNAVKGAAGSQAEDQGENGESGAAGARALS
eukprot:6463317-Amphidinium_carterae.1